jgi:hypothetical protein
MQIPPQNSTYCLGQGGGCDQAQIQPNTASWQNQAPPHFIDPEDLDMRHLIWEITPVKATSQPQY